MYEFLEEYVQRSKSVTLNTDDKALILPVKESDLIELRSHSEFDIPDQLANFFKEIGYGFFNVSSNSKTANLNRMCHPKDIVEILQGTYEGFVEVVKVEPNALPFFEVDVGLLLCLKPKSENPNAVWWMWGELMPNGGKICDSLVEFFQRLVEDPNWFNPSKP
jgi:antitoxin YxxD